MHMLNVNITRFILAASYDFITDVILKTNEINTKCKFRKRESLMFKPF